jgi:LPXTG-motif cell wall-anchored protein
MKYLKLSLLAFALVLSLSPRAHAFGGHNYSPPPPPPPPPPPSPRSPAKTAPEVDPSLALGGLTLLGGTLTVLRSRRKK